MTSAQQQLIRALYQAALERPPGERAAFVAARTAGDPELREAVERLLSQSEPTGVVGSAEAEELAPGTMLGHYRIDSVIGRGGMGIVYRATDSRLARSVAVKFLSAQLADTQARRRFAQEAETASALNHPHIVTVLDVGEHDGRQYIVSELVDGGTLNDRWTAGGERGWRQSVELLIGVADALAAAHAAGVLHRDVKPGNILLGSNGYAKLADFGLAKLFENPGGSPPSRLLTGAGVVVGTVAYMSPEQAGGRPLDARSDIFSFGIVLYEALAGRRPFEADNDLELLKTIVHGTPPPLPADVPEQLRNVVERALEKDPADRYQAMRELVIELKRIVRKSASAAQSGPVAAAAGAPKKRRAWPWVALGLAITVAALFAPSVMRALRAPAGGGEPAASATQRAFEYVQVTTSGNVTFGAAISADGRYVVYAENGSTGASLWLRQVDTPSSVRLVEAPPNGVVGFPTVTPDMRSVDFIRTADGSVPSLWRVPFLGGTARPFVEDVWSPVAWSVDGRRMAFVRVDPVTNDSALVVADAEGASQRVLATRAAPNVFVALFVVGNPMRPAWSPDGEVIALYALEPDPRLVLVDAETGEETVVDTKSGPLPQGLAWLGASELVLNQPELGSTRVQLWRMSYPGGTVVPLSNDASSLVGVDVDASRQTLATTRRELRMGVWLQETDGGTRNLVPPALYAGVGVPFARPTWYGNSILFPTTADGRPALSIVPADGGAAQELVANAVQGDIGEDGTIVFMRGTDGLWVTDTSGRRPERLVAERAFEPRILPDRSVLYLSVRTGVQTIWRLPLDGGEPVQVDAAFASLATMDVSLDGRRLLFGSVRDAAVVLVTCDLPACTNRVERSVSLATPRWAPDGESIEYLDTTLRNVWSVPLEGGTPRQVTAFSDGTIAAFARSPDGRRLALLRYTASEDVVLLRGLR